MKNYLQLRYVAPAVFVFTSTVAICQSNVAAVQASGATPSQLTMNLTAETIPAAPVDANSITLRPLGLAGKKDPPPVGFNAHDDGDDIPAIQSPGFYPADLSNPNKKPAVVKALSHDIYIDNPSSHWGDPETFLKDLGKSEMIELVDQYTGVSGGHRYKLGDSLRTKNYLGGKKSITETQIINLVYSASIFEGNGLGHIYHVFLPKGVDTCFDPTPGSTQQVCYSPDNQDTFYFCAYHGAVSLKDGTPLLYTVEPYQNVIGCSVPPKGSANGPLIDSTNSVLSHELFEVITDPLINAWYVRHTFAGGEEIGDLCIRSFQASDKNFYWDYGKVRLNNHWYTIQPEYSNFFHGCAYSDFERP